MKFLRYPNNSGYHRGRRVKGFEEGDNVLPLALPDDEDGLHDDHLRWLVDQLPLAEAYMVSSCAFGQQTAEGAAAEAGLTAATGRKVLRAGLDCLRFWIEHPDLAPTEDSATGRCTVELDGERCAQPKLADDTRCAAHAEWQEYGIVPDPGYERRVVAGEVTPAVATFTRSELDTMMEGRHKGDGRRLDAYAGDPPIILDTATDYD